MNYLCFKLFFISLIELGKSVPPSNITDKPDKQYWRKVEAVGARTTPDQPITVYDNDGYPKQSL